MDSGINCIFAGDKRFYIMSYTKTTTIKHPSRELEERIRWIGVQKYLRLEKLAKEELPSARIITA